MKRTYTEGLLEFTESCPTAFHAAEVMARMLDQKGYVRLLESEEWELEEEGKYYCIRGGSSLIAFRLPSYSIHGFQIFASHSDSPCLKVKENPDITAEAVYRKLNVEKYGGVLLSTWFDRPLSVAGRVMVKDRDGILIRLMNIDRDLLMIPSLAIHMNRTANEGMNLSIQKELLPLYGLKEDPDQGGTLMELVANELEVEPEDILGSDLYLYNRMPGTIWGANREFLSGARLDDLACAYASLQGFLMAEEGENIPMHVLLDSEEVGSRTRQGACSTFLYDVISRINRAAGGSESDLVRRLACSMMISADNAHAVHPNYPEKACPTNRPVLGGGIVLKFSGSQTYMSDGFSTAVFREICDRADVPVQVYTNHSDVRGGSTLGNLSGTKVSIPGVDIGLPQLAMHSCYETIGAGDLDHLVKAAAVFYESALEETGYNSWKLLPDESNY